MNTGSISLGHVEQAQPVGTESCSESHGGGGGNEKGRDHCIRVEESRADVIMYNGEETWKDAT